jgi:hypothetical protein
MTKGPGSRTGALCVQLRHFVLAYSWT